MSFGKVQCFENKNDETTFRINELSFDEVIKLFHLRRGFWDGDVGQPTILVRTEICNIYKYIYN